MIKILLIAALAVFATMAHAQEATRKIHVSFFGDGGGIVLFSPPSVDMNVSCNVNCEFTYPSGATVTLTAIPAGDSTFADWGAWCQKRTMPPGVGPSSPPDPATCQLIMEG